MSDDTLCKQCGRCCRKKEIINGKPFYTDDYCEYNDRNTHLCTIYKNRHDLNQYCLTVEKGIGFGVFPSDCPYVQDLEDYEGPGEPDEVQKETSCDRGGTVPRAS